MPPIAALLLPLWSLLPIISASVPMLAGFSVVWSDDFQGDHYAGVDTAKWNQFVGRSDNNAELEFYTPRTNNVHLSGDGQVYIVPTLSNGTWYSARLESVASQACDEGRAMVFQASLWVPDLTGSPPEFAGLWPAFWALGNDLRTDGVLWPECGEWDIFEATNKLGDMNQGTLHFQNADGSHNDSFHGRTVYTTGQYHTWALEVDRRSSDWTKQAVTWYLDDTAFYTVTGAQIGGFQEWTQLADRPYYIILNMAIGGDYPGDPTSQTLSGFDASMRVEYVAIYKSD
ncbi:Glycoside hydrolase family 16 protein [Mycena venus]|uniref:Glycoside hydrolase family 16 protein n=1 Tax=Mycena venus TaxID=2733690 RepID=A0A8H6Z3W3_9AGAR|nr:Glycoside hydrolase family 16 protein [Mycena venus]